MRQQEVTVRNVVADDLDDVVAMHIAAFPGFLMSLLGPSFLRKYYQSVLDSQGHIFVGAFRPEGQLVGFIAGFANPPEFYRLFRRRKKQMMAAAFFHVAFRPAIWKRVLENMRQVQTRGHVADGADRIAELASLAVDPESPRRGYGRLLVNVFLQHARQRCLQRVTLTTDAADNEPVNAFYRRMGFCCSGTFQRAGGRVMNSYSYEIERESVH